MHVEPSEIAQKQKSYRAWTDKDGISHPSVNYAIVDRTHGSRHYPVTGVGWIGAAEYCRWLQKKTGRPYRLPTEEEWEYACRAGSTNAFFWGNDPTKAAEYGWFLANSAEEDSAEATHPVGQLKPNRFGLFDVAGNVAEWCQKKSPEASSVLRGGAFCSPLTGLRSAARWIEHPEWDELDPEIPRSPWWLTAGFAGFRIALDAKAPRMP
jgi:formylglycine-generating enzyme required for sulfatase activity